MREVVACDARTPLKVDNLYNLTFQRPGKRSKKALDRALSKNAGQAAGVGNDEDAITTSHGQEKMRPSSAHVTPLPTSGEGCNRSFLSG